MAKKKQQLVHTIFGFLTAFIFSSCANQMSPPGGDIDKTPPTIISTYPEVGTVNFNETEIEFTFSEYVNKRNINDAFFISPLIDGLPEFSWTNRTVYIEFPDTLNSNTTYSVIIGTEITDFNNNNNMSEPYILTFSTGSTIDSGRIKGRVLSENAQGALIFAYKDSLNTIDIYNQKPNYLSQIDEKGYYELTGLGIGSYRLFAVKDEFKDLVYNIGDDLIGLAYNDITLENASSAVDNIDFLMQLEDTLSPSILNVTMTDKNHLVVEFDESIDSTFISVDDFRIVDSTMNKNFPIKYWYRAKSNKDEYVLSFTDSLSVDNEVFLHSSNISDRKGNRSGIIQISFAVSEMPDTNHIRLIAVETPYEGGKFDYISPSFILQFDDAFDTDEISRAVKMYSSDSVLIPVLYEALNDAQVKLMPSGDIEEKSEYSVRIDMQYLIDAAGNKIDTVITKKISTVSNLDFSGASGVVLNNSENIKVVLKSLNRDNKNYQRNVDEDNKFDFKRIIPGKYQIWTYIDADSSNTYSFGSINPFSHSEFFNFYPDTLNLRARWPVGDIQLDLTKKK